MKHYSYGEITVTDRGWVQNYLAHVNGLIAKHGGKVLARTLSFERVEGDQTTPTNVILIEWPSREAARAFFDDPEYGPLREQRRAGSTSEITLFSAEDLVDSRPLR